MNSNIQSVIKSFYTKLDSYQIGYYGCVIEMKRKNFNKFKCMEGACVGGILKIVKILRFDVNIRCYFSYACKGKHMNVIEFMMANDYGSVNEGLWGACEGGHFDLVKIFLSKEETIKFSKGAFTKAAECIDSGLERACINGNLELINYLIDKGAERWNCALAGACEGGHVNIIDDMIMRGADEWNRALAGACKGGHMNIIERFIKYPSVDLSFAMGLAACGGQLNVIKYLITKGAKPDNFTFSMASTGMNDGVYEYIRKI